MTTDERTTPERQSVATADHTDPGGSAAASDAAATPSADPSKTVWYYGMLGGLIVWTLFVLVAFVDLTFYAWSFLVMLFTTLMLYVDTRRVRSRVGRDHLASRLLYTPWVFDTKRLPGFDWLLNWGPLGKFPFGWLRVLVRLFVVYFLVSLQYPVAVVAAWYAVSGRSRALAVDRPDETGTGSGKEDDDDGSESTDGPTVTTIRASADRAADLVDDGDRHAEAGRLDADPEAYDAAVRAYEDAREEYRYTLDSAREIGLGGSGWFDIDYFEDRLAAVEARIAESATAGIDARLTLAESLLREDPAAAEPVFARVRTDVEDLDDGGPDDEDTGFDPEAIAALHAWAREGHVRAGIARARADLSAVETDAEDVPPGETAEAYDDIEDRLTSVRATAREYGVEELETGEGTVRSEVDALLDRCREGAEAARSRETSPPPSVEAFVDSELPDYEFVRQIGGGGNADVFELRRTETGEGVALKIPRWRFDRTLTTSDVEGFVREAETWQRVDGHPNVAEVLDYGKRPFPWMVLELVDSSLRDRLDGLSVRERMDVLVAVASALEFAHGHAVVHLDVKPENILLDEDGTPKVADWGLARVVFELTKSQVGLTPAYSAPEQIDHTKGTLDRQTDVYQFGVLVYEVLTGRLPFDATSTIDLARSILTGTPDAPSQVNPDLPTALDAPVLTALATEKADRYEAIIQFRDALLAVREDLLE